MITLKVKSHNPLFLEFEGKTVEIYAKCSKTSDTNFIRVMGPREVGVYRVGAHCSWPKVKDTVFTRKVE